MNKEYTEAFRTYIIGVSSGKVDNNFLVSKGLIEDEDSFSEEEFPDDDAMENNGFVFGVNGKNRVQYSIY